MDLSVLRRGWPLASVVALLALAAVAAPHSSLEFSRVTPAGDQLAGKVPALSDYSAELPSQPPRPIADVEQSRIPEWLSIVAGALCGIVVLVIIGLLLWALIRDLLRRRTDRKPPEVDPRRSPKQTAAEVVAALDAGLVDLSDSDADPRRAVIACWVRLEQAAAAAGLPRQVADTPTDLVTRLLGGDGTQRASGADVVSTSGPAVVSVDVLAAFAGVYREARYATHAVDEEMRAHARSALQRLRAELTTGVGR